ncbi:hypothetical protein [Phreatobacter cathodiphilus]|uniref:DUF3828 domain-containing protein n=1 Tax=Phreatobacter cathodiphilus TaxID=1868589 RepID=A0A2S0NCQ4_9HYPH|nr:hypothetical protein [Phreatobacter cathodiphilus]AVO45703.1 hypothetical protein C6569_11855 [Phreatobacter cathodiphilus]
MRWSLRGAVLACVLFAAAPAAAQRPAPSSGSAAYDRLDLKTPESALRTFLTAYRRGDYVTAFWVLTPISQTAFYTHLARFDLSRVARVPASSAYMHAAEMIPAPSQMDQTDISFVFAHAMTVARRLDLMPLNLAGMPEDMSPANMPRLGNRIQLTDGKVEFSVPLQAYRSPVVFRMVQAAHGRWRLEQILPPGGAVDSLPFGLPTE